jgi:hypothetical protein
MRNLPTACQSLLWSEQELNVAQELAMVAHGKHVAAADCSGKQSVGLFLPRLLHG